MTRIWSSACPLLLHVMLLLCWTLIFLYCKLITVVFLPCFTSYFHLTPLPSCRFTADLLCVWSLDSLWLSSLSDIEHADFDYIVIPKDYHVRSCECSKMYVYSHHCLTSHFPECKLSEHSDPILGCFFKAARVSQLKACDKYLARLANFRIWDFSLIWSAPAKTWQVIQLQALIVCSVPVKSCQMFEDRFIF